LQKLDRSRFLSPLSYRGCNNSRLAISFFCTVPCRHCLQIVYKLCDSLTHICMGGETLMRWREEKQAESLAGSFHLLEH
jgi:hypothetical protein